VYVNYGVPADYEELDRRGIDVAGKIVIARYGGSWRGIKPSPWPARSTLHALLERHGLVRQQRRQRRWTHPGAAPVHTEAPNQVWPADFKGQFKTGDGRYCYPLTITDHFSRTLLACRGLSSVRTAYTQPVFRALFSRGRPARGHSDGQRGVICVDGDPRAVGAQR